MWYVIPFVLRKQNEILVENYYFIGEVFEIFWQTCFSGQMGSWKFELGGWFSHMFTNFLFPTMDFQISKLFFSHDFCIFCATFLCHQCSHFNQKIEVDQQTVYLAWKTSWKRFAWPPVQVWHFPWLKHWYLKLNARVSVAIYSLNHVFNIFHLLLWMLCWEGTVCVLLRMGESAVLSLGLSLWFAHQTGTAVVKRILGRAECSIASRPFG